MHRRQIARVAAKMHTSVGIGERRDFFWPQHSTPCHARSETRFFARCGPLRVRPLSQKALGSGSTTKLEETLKALWVWAKRLIKSILQLLRELTATDRSTGGQNFLHRMPFGTGQIAFASAASSYSLTTCTALPSVRPRRVSLLHHAP